MKQDLFAILDNCSLDFPLGLSPSVSLPTALADLNVITRFNAYPSQLASDFIFFSQHARYVVTNGKVVSCTNMQLAQSGKPDS